MMYTFGANHFDMAEVTMISVENMAPVSKTGESKEKNKVISIYFSGCLKPTITEIREDNDLTSESIKRLLKAFKESCDNNGYIEEAE